MKYPATLTTVALLMIAGYWLLHARLATESQMSESNLIDSRTAPDSAAENRSTLTTHQAAPPASSPTYSPHQSPALPQALEQTAENAHGPNTEALWQQEIRDSAFAETNEPALWHTLTEVDGVQVADVECRSRLCKVSVVLRAGMKLDDLNADISGLSPYRKTAQGWEFFYDPNQALDSTDQPQAD